MSKIVVDSQMVTGSNPRGKSGHRRTGCWLTASKGNLKESATEIYRQIIGKVERAR